MTFIAQSTSQVQLPSRDESGSYAQFSNDARGNSVFQNSNSFSFKTIHIEKCFRHVFSVIGPTGAEIWPIKVLSKNIAIPHALALVATHASEASEA